MTWPHQRSFRGRSLIFWGLLLAALLRARSVPGVSARVVALGALVAAVVCGVIYAYTATLGRHDARFRQIHPRKFRIVDVGGFYLFASKGTPLRRQTQKPRNTQRSFWLRVQRVLR